MTRYSWTPAEKKIARRAFDAALQVELARVMTEFKRLAETAVTPDDMWAVQDYLDMRRKRLYALFDYRYSQLVFLFGQMVGEGLIPLSDLQGLSEDKLAQIAFIAHRA